MQDDRAERIRRRAHQLWEQGGRPDGKHEEHWAQAVREIDDERPASEAETKGGGIDEAALATAPGGLSGLSPGTKNSGDGTTGSPGRSRR